MNANLVQIAIVDHFKQMSQCPPTIPHVFHIANFFYMSESGILHATIDAVDVKRLTESVLKTFPRYLHNDNYQPFTQKMIELQR